MALKCRCICGCKLLVSSASAGKRIKCPKCERKLRVPVDVVEKRRAQLEARQASPQPTHRRTKIERPLSSVVDLPDPPPPPIHAVTEEPSPAAASPERPTKPPVASELTETDDIVLPVQGYAADRDKIATVRWLAAAILLTALVGMVPAIIDVVEHSLSPTSEGLSRWACALLLIGVLQCAYAVYLVQLPDWSSVWIVTCFTLGIAASYAAMFGLTLLSSDQGHFVQLFGLADRLRGGKATAWCLIMLSLMSLTSYFSGRVAARWRNAFV